MKIYPFVCGIFQVIFVTFSIPILVMAEAPQGLKRLEIDCKQLTQNSTSSISEMDRAAERDNSQLSQNALQSRISLLDELAGLHQELDEMSYFHREQAVVDVVNAREKEGLTNDSTYIEALYRLGRLQWKHGRLELAEDTLRRCTVVAESVLGKESLKYASCQHWLGVVYKDEGLYEKAREALKDAVARREHILGTEHPDYAYALFTLGSVYSALNDYSTAESLYLQALSIREARFGLCGRVVADSLNNLAYIYRATGRPKLAIPLHERALAIRIAWLGEDDALVAQSMSNLGVALSDIGLHTEAQKYLLRSLEIRDRQLGPDHFRTVISVANLVESLRNEGRLLEAGPLLLRGFRGALISGDPSLVWRLSDAYRAYYQQQGQAEVAIFFGKYAVNAVQRVRSQFNGLDPQLQHSFLDHKSRIYRDLATILMEQHRLLEAEQVLGMLKEYEFFEYVPRGTRSDVRTSRSALTTEEKELAARLDENARVLTQIDTEADALRKLPSLSSEQQQRSELLVEQRRVENEKLLKIFGTIKKQLDQRGRPEQSAQIDALVRSKGATEGLLKSLQESSKQIPALIYFLPSERNTLFLIHTGKKLRLKQGGLNSSSLYKKIFQFREAIKKRDMSYQTIGAELYDELIKPIEEELTLSGVNMLMLYLTDDLRYLPFSALYDINTRKHLIEKYPLAVYTHVGRDRLHDLPQEIWTAVGLGTSQKTPKYKALPWAASEIRHVVRDPNSEDAEGIIIGKRYLDNEFNQALFMKLLRPEKASSVMHLATHFNLVPGNDDDSELILGSGEEVKLSTIAIHSELSGYELITLSACETGLGSSSKTGTNSNPVGAEVEGLGAVLQQQGAKAVLVTLWKVEDAGTALLMEQFYRSRGEKHIMTKAQALREAQVSLIQGTVKTNSVQEGNLRLPYYWAPFFLMGNWL